MGIFNDLKKNQYVENMTTMSRTNLSLLDTLNKLQIEYEKLLKKQYELEREIDKLKKK